MAETTKKTETTAKAEPKKVAPKTTTKTAVKKAPVARTAEEKAPAVAEQKTEAKAPAKKTNVPMLKITLVKSASGRLEKQRRTLEALALRKIGNTTVKPDNAQTRGMIFVVKHLVSVESVKEN